MKTSFLRRLARHITVILGRMLGPLFFDSQYLVGRHFAANGNGWRWVIRSVWTQKILGTNRRVPWPVGSNVVVGNPSNIRFHPDDLNNFQSFGIYFQSYQGRIELGEGTYISPNVGLITANHDPENPSRHLEAKQITVGKSCWIGMNAVILPGVTLGDHTTVGAGSVVTRSFPNGRCVIAGNPARIIREIAGDAE